VGRQVRRLTDVMTSAKKNCMDDVVTDVANLREMVQYWETR
jgi:hypothetical protein